MQTPGLPISVKAYPNGLASSRLVSGSDPGQAGVTRAGIDRWFRESTVVTLSATDNQNGSGVNNITYSLSGAQPGSGTVTGSTTTVPLLAEGVTTMTFFATDKAGNQEVPKSVTVKIDKTPPILRCTATPAILKATGNLEKVNLSGDGGRSVVGTGGIRTDFDRQ